MDILIRKTDLKTTGKDDVRGYLIFVIGVKKSECAGEEKDNLI